MPKVEEDVDSTGSLISSLDRLQQMALKARQNVLGEKFFQEIEKFYNLSYLRAVQSPSFRPNIMVPELQMLMLQEASDLLDSAPRIYVSELKKMATGIEKERKKGIEKAIQAQWESGFYNLHILMAEIWALFAGNGYIQVWYDDDANGGLGEVKLLARDPSTVYVDPNATSDADAWYVQVEDTMYLDEIEARYPEKGHTVRPSLANVQTRPSGVNTLDFTPGPMRSVGDLIMRQPGGFEQQVTVRTTFIRDSSREPWAADEPGPKGMPKPKYRLRYPNGRMIVDAGGVILYDGNNVVPSGEFPIVRYVGLPPLTGYYAPPPVNFSRDLQHLAEKFFSRTYENALRVNNVITYVYKGSGINISKFGGLPGEVHELNLQGKKPDVQAVPPFPDSIIKMPGTLLELQKGIHNFTGSRLGNPGAGNISAPLFEGAISQAQGMTRLRGKLLAPAITRTARIVLAYMQKFYGPDHDFEVVNGEDPEYFSWEGQVNARYRVAIDPGSIKPMSQTAIRALAPKLAELHMIDQKALLDILEFPDREGIMERMQKAAQEMALMQAKEKLEKHNK